MKGLLVPILAAAFLFPAGCDLFTNLPETDLEKKIDAQVAWAHAPFVNVQIRSIPGSVNTISPSVGTQKVGYPFSVDFTADPAWAF